MTSNLKILLNLPLLSVSAPSQLAIHRYSASPEYSQAEFGTEQHFRDFVISDLGKSSIYRNSYRYRKCLIYETVKLNQIKLSNQFNYSESEKDLKLSLNMI